MSTYDERVAQGDTRLEQPDLAEEARERRDAAEVERRDEEQHRDDRRGLQEPAEPGDGGRPAAPLDQSRREEQCGLHDDVVDDVVDRGGRPGDRADARCRRSCSRCGSPA